MTTEELLKANLDKFFEFTFSDGETTVGRLLRVNERNNEFVYEMSSTNEPKRYHNRLGKYAASISDLQSAQLLDKD
jgi:hypothetical protein